VPRRLNDLKVADHLTRDFRDRQSTLYRDIFRLPAAHSLTVDSGGVRVERYWSLDCDTDLRLGSDEEYAEAFRERFIEAVHCRTRGAVSVGSTLSGGLDSSSIASTANLVLEEHQRPLHTFSAVFPSLSGQALRQIDERSYIQAVLRSAAFNPAYVHADQISPLADRVSLSRCLGEACVAPNLYIHLGLYRAAAERGIRVLLDGIDGDTTVSHGWDHLTDLFRAGRWTRFVGETRAVLRRNPAHSFQSLVWQLAIRPHIPNGWRSAWRSLRYRSRERHEEQGLLSPRLAARVRARGFVEEPSPGKRVASRATLNHWRALNSPLIPYAMEFADAASSSCGIEVRYPFFDRRLIEFCVAVPGDQKIRDGWTRSIMRRALHGILPPEIQWRSGKADLSPNFSRGLIEKDREIIRRVVYSPTEWLNEYVNVPAVQSAFTRWTKEPGRCSNEALDLFAVTTLGLWLEATGFAGQTAISDDKSHPSRVLVGAGR
jgi:asparagine synthase (glutamine-hydrolysing)